MQGNGWLPITSLDLELPYWLGLWLGVYPTWETIGAQLGSALFVIGSFFLAKELKVKRPQRRARVARPAAAISDRLSMKEGGLSTWSVVRVSGSSVVLWVASGAHLSIASSAGGPGDIGGRLRGRKSGRAVRRPDEKRRLSERSWVRRVRCW